MPIYEYQCEKCGQVTEILQQSNDTRTPDCGQCDGKLKRIISQTSFILKGSGWYVTDYPSETRKKGMQDEKKEVSGKKKKDAKKAKEGGESAPAQKKSPSVPVSGKSEKPTSSRKK